MSETSAPLLQMEGIRKSFVGVEVLHGVDLDLHVGEVHAVVGVHPAIDRLGVVDIIDALVDAEQELRLGRVVDGHARPLGLAVLVVEKARREHLTEAPEQGAPLDHLVDAR